MNITITLSFQDLQKIISESATMRTLCSPKEIIRCRDNFILGYSASSMEGCQKRIILSAKVLAINYLIEQAFRDDLLKDRLRSLGCSFDNESGKLCLADAKQIVEEYFY